MSDAVVQKHIRTGGAGTCWKTKSMVLEIWDDTEL